MCGWLSARCAGSKKRKRVNRNEGIGTEQKEISSSINFLLGKIFNGAGIKEKKRKKKRKEWKIGLASVVFSKMRISMLAYRCYRIQEKDELRRKNDNGRK